jgi:drug/metabolite transporter (DMT)-like permease
MQKHKAVSIENDALIGAIFVFISAIAFSAKAIFIKLAYAYYPIDAITLLALRMLIATPFVLAMSIFASQNHSGTRLNLRDWISIISLGLSGMYLSSLFDFIGLTYISAGLERSVLFLYPTFVVIISALHTGNAIGKRELLALFLSWSGIVLIAMHDISFGQTSSTLLGTSFVLLSALCYASYLVGSGQVIHKIGTQRFTGYSMMVACIACIFHFSVTHSVASLNLPLRIYALGLGLALISLVLPAILLNAGIKKVGSSAASLISSVGPVSTILMAAIFLNEAITVRQILGTSLVLAGVLTITIPLAKKKGIRVYD